MADPDVPPVTVTYWAISILSSRTAQFAFLTFLLGVLSLPEVVSLIPLRYLPVAMAVIGVINLALRYATVRPAMFIAPGTSAPVAVAKIDPPKPRVVSLTD